MRAAPPVDYPLARQGGWDGAGCLLAALAVMTPVVWACWQWHTTSALPSSAATAWLVAGGLAALFSGALYWRSAGRRAPSRLRWDGTRWQRLGMAPEAEELLPPEIRIDLGVALLLRARPAHGGLPLHLALEWRDAPTVWHALRVALVQAQPERAAASTRPDPGALA